MRRTRKSFDLPNLTRVDRLRRVHGFSLREMEEEAGVSRSTLARILKGQEPGLFAAFRIARILELKVEEIWEEEAKSQAPR